MPESFTLDTSGHVLGVHKPWAGGGVKRDGCWTWPELTPLAQGYIAAMLEAERGEGSPDDPATCSGLWVEVEPGLWSNDLGFSDLAPEALASILADCERFRALPLGDDTSEHGRRFWELRQAGANSNFPPVRVYLDDAGKVQHVAEGAGSIRVGGAARFNDTASDGWGAGVRVTVTRRLGPDEADGDAGPMYEIQRADGATRHAFADELEPEA